VEREKKQAAIEQSFGSTTQSQAVPLELHPEKLVGIAESEITTVVTGLPRSGTSLVMQILQAAGISPNSDENRQADESNPAGYFEKFSTPRRRCWSGWIELLMHPTSLRVWRRPIETS